MDKPKAKVTQLKPEGVPKPPVIEPPISAEELKQRPDPMIEVRKKLAAMQRQMDELNQRLAAQRAALGPLPPKLKEAAPLKEYKVAIVNPDSSIREFQRSSSRTVLTPPEGLNVLEVPGELWDKIQAGLNGLTVPGVSVSHYYLNGAFHQQKVLLVKISPEPYKHPCKIKVEWDKGLGPIKFREGAREVSLTDSVQLDGKEAGTLSLEVIDPRFAYQCFNLKVD